MKINLLKSRNGFVVLFSAISFGFGAQTLQSNMWKPNEDVRSIKISPDDATIYLAGTFDYFTAPGISSAIEYGLTFQTDETFVPSFSSANGPINIIISDDAGGFIISGNFTAVGGVNMDGLAHINSDGTVDTSFDPDITLTTGTITDLALIEDKLFACGNFDGTVDATDRDYIFGVSLTDGSLLTGFDPQPDGIVNAIETWKAPVSGNEYLIAGGKFTNVSATGRNLMAAWDVTTGTSNLLSWNPNVRDTDYPTDQEVKSIDLQNGTANPQVLIGGKFNTSGAYTRYNISVINGVNDDGTGTGGTGSLDAPIRYNSDHSFESVYTVAFSPDNSIAYATGPFDRAGSTASVRKGVAAIYVTGGSSNQATAWDPSVGAGSYSSFTFMQASDRLYVSDGPNNGLVAYDLTSADVPTLTSWGVDVASDDFYVAGSVSGVLCSDGTNIYIGLGGRKEKTNEVIIRRNLAALNANTGALTAFNPIVDGPVQDLGLTSDGTLLYLAGSFANVNGNARLNIAAINTATGTETSFNNASDLSANSIELMALSTADDRLYIKTSADEMIAITSAGAVDAGFTYDGVIASNTRQIMLSSDNTVLYSGTNGAGVEFSAVDVMTGDLATGLDVYDDLYSAGGVFGFFTKGGTTYICGTFDEYNGATTHSKLVKFSNGVLVDVFRPSFDASVRRIYQHGAVLYVLGQFNTVNGVAREGLAAIDTITGQTTLCWNPDADNFSDTHPRIEVNETTGKIYLAERNFSTLCGSNVVQFASLNPVMARPASLSTTDIQLTEATLNWNHVNAEELRVALRKVGTTIWQYRNATYADNYTFTASGFSKNATYEWKVRFRDGNCWSDWSATENFVVCAYPVAATALNETNIFSNKVTLNWTQSTTVEEIRVALRKVGNATWNYKNAAYSTNSYDWVSNFTPNANYEWMIRMRCGSTWGPWSATHSFTSGTVAGMKVQEENNSFEEHNPFELADFTIDVYPNPSDGNFTISSTHAGEFAIVNELGQKIRTVEITKEMNYQTKIENLEKGVYFLTGIIDSEMLTHKILVQ